MTQIITFPDDKKNNPVLGKNSFICPYPKCSQLAIQDWHPVEVRITDDGSTMLPCINGEQLMIAICQECNNPSLWKGENLIYPAVKSNAPPPNKDLSPKVMKIYWEAALVMQESPRAAAGLLRLAIETLCIELKCEGKSLQDKINNLVKKDNNLQEVVEAMDIVRLVGNAGVHAGIIEINENSDIVVGMFKLINYAAERLITGPKERKSIIDDANKLREESKKQKSELGRE